MLKTNSAMFSIFFGLHLLKDLFRIDNFLSRCFFIYMNGLDRCIFLTLQATGLGGQAVKGHDTGQVETMQKVDRPIKVRFNADVASSMRWNFRPQQTEVTVMSIRVLNSSVDYHYGKACNRI